MSSQKNHYTNVLKFWRSVETFTLPDIPGPRKNDSKVFTNLVPGGSLPWESDAFPVRDGRKWIHTLYFHVLEKEAVVAYLARLSESKEFRERVNGRTCLSTLVLDTTGQPVERTYAAAAFAYGIKVIREGQDPEEVTSLLKKAQEDFFKRFQMPRQAETPRQTDAPGQAGTPWNDAGTLRGEPAGQSVEKEDGEPEINRVNWSVLEKELLALKSLVPKELQVGGSILCVSESVFSAVKPEAPFLNSYYLNDLNKLIGQENSLGQPLETFLREEINLAGRENLLDPAKMLETLDPRKQSLGRWPSHPSLGLYSAQQAALNLSLPGLRDGTGLIGINGPPGTGKTTLLREIVADVVVTRARRLLGKEVTELFVGKRISIVDTLGYFKINEAIAGNDGIVVSSNNNSAIENISKELPALKGIDKAAFEDAAYFSRFATVIQEEPCWGMLSATLGKAENRNAFVNRFWYNKGSGFGRYLKAQSEDPVECKKNAETYKEKAGNLRSLLEEYDRFKDLAGAYHDGLCKILFTPHSDVSPGETGKERLHALGKRLELEYGLKPDNLPGLDFLSSSTEKIHRLTPYSSEKISGLRSRIFLASLELHEYAIRVNARYFNSNLNAFINIVSNKHADFVDEEAVSVLWHSFFFCIPVVAVTLASFQRQFAKIDKGRIGWLLLDEAGQATPASACGAIWRSRRCIIIGDTRQIPPVVTIPRGLGRLLQEDYTIADNCWSPLEHSAQFLADRVTPIGTYIESDDGIRTWTGMPLRAHRRCNEPMFSISNRIAYSGQMVKVSQGVSGDFPTGASGWIDVKGITFSNGHAVVEELQVLEDLLQILTYFEGKVYVISPFRSVAETCRDEFKKKYRAEYGTIHTFQGKEAEIVFLVMGTHPDSIGARNWVASSPNILNVAVTRAKERLYVIGNRELWSSHVYFDQLAERLPVKEHFSGRLF